MASNKVGCSVGKTILVDPNTFDGQNSSNNISVPLEDLSISVQLETRKKGRTVLSTDSSITGVISNTGESTQDLKVTFIEGTNISGEKVLTTRYTDLTTSFDSNSDTENLGITAIDIDFNSSYAPMITIQFVDIRGSSVFQNEANLKRGINKYSTFFQLPYPIYKLTVKGYYGMPVTYCLHMLKFSAKFNSQTGNFEISANFIGYTYAMLSDMLLGYLKAVPYTKLGADKYTELKKTQPNLLNLNELMVAISNIDVTTQKIKSSDPNYADLANGENKKSQLEDVKTNLFILGQELDINGELDNLEEYNFIINDPKKTDTNNIIDKYNTNITNAIKVYNEGNSITLDSKEFTNIVLTKYGGLSLKLLNSTDQDDISIIQTRINVPPSDFNKIKSSLLKYLTKNYSLQPDFVFDVYNLEKQYSIIQDKLDSIINEMKKLKKKLSETLRAAVSSSIGFDPSVRNIINIFTTAVEVWMYVLQQVSASAGSLSNDDRTAQLKKFTLDAFDYKSNAVGSTPNNGPAGSLQSLYYPWPDFRVKDVKSGWVETYLGNPESGVSKPSDVDELSFINNLLKAFLIAAAESEQAKLSLIQASTNWFPSNPLDTRLFISNFPYKRIEGNSYNEVFTLLLIRAMTFIGFSNKKLTPAEITTIANAEVQAIMENISNEKVLQSLGSFTSNDILNTKNVINGNETNIVKLNTISGEYDYNYIIESSQQKLIPISSNFNGEWSTNLNTLTQESNDGKLFLSNYTTTPLKNTSGSGNILYKVNDGGIYMKILERETYYSNSIAFPLVSPDLSTNNVLLLEKLEDSPSAFQYDSVGFNILGGTYGIQEFTTLNYGVDKMDAAPFMYMFYQNSNDGSEIFNKTNGLGFIRKKNPIKQQISINYASSVPSPEILGKINTPYDILGTYVFRIADNINDIMQYVDGEKAIHSDYGKTRVLINDYVKGNQEVTYPYINYFIKLDSASDGKKLAPVSLFGSRLYYEQTNKYAKALLFLHTFPWNGLFSNEDSTIFDVNEILNTFSNRAGFISAPKLWVAFIGGMLWRADSSQPIFEDYTNRQIGGGSGILDPLIFRGTSGLQSDEFIPTFTPSTAIPNRREYLTKKLPNSQMVFSNDNGNGYKQLDSILLTLPDQAKEEFIQVFLDFVVSSDVSSISDWDKISNQLEIFKGTGTQWVTAFTSTISSSYIHPSLNERVLPYITTKNTYSVINGGINNFNNYIVFTPSYRNDYLNNNYFLELKDGTQAVKTLMDLLTNEIIISNSSINIWKGNDNSSTSFPQLRQPISVKDTDLKLYIDTIVQKLNENKDSLSSSNKKKQTEQEIFGTADENLIKLQMYRTCKNIYDKWIGGSNGQIFQGACSGRNSIDIELAKLAGRSENDLKLIDSFRFVNRSFKDIGNDLIINPMPINEYLINNPNSSFYDVVSSLLASNNFDFIPLPSYINYGDEKTLESMFKPMSSAEAFDKGTIGPSFVCVYVGQKSKHLDFGDSDYSNDGFDIRCDSSGGIMQGLPEDFTQEALPYENKVSVFAVNYGQQNQNIFKDLTLDQSEFSETAESLKITDDIANKGVETNKSLAGQNIYNVYSVRSYKTQVEMMGNAMIQPMMYFQLNNIPMFHGAYMITQVSHSIKPNYMSTHFTGVRIRNVDTPLADVSDLFMTLLDSLDSSEIKRSEPTRDFGTIGIGYSGSKYGPDGSNNPGNLRPYKQCGIPKGVLGSKGCAESNVGTFLEFKDIIYGIQAAIQTIKTSIGNDIAIADGYKGNRRTLLTYLMRYATPNENDTNAYVNIVGNKLKKIDSTFQWNTLLALNPNFTTNVQENRKTVGWENPNTSENYIKLRAITTNGSPLLEPGLLPTGGGSDLVKYKQEYTNSKGQSPLYYSFIKSIVTTQLQVESNAGAIINLLNQDQFWILWQNQYNGEKSIFGNWGTFDGNQYIDKMFVETKFFGRPNKVGNTWINQIPKQYWI